MIHARRVLGVVFIGSIGLERGHSSWKTCGEMLPKYAIPENEVLTYCGLSSHILF